MITSSYRVVLVFSSIIVFLIACSKLEPQGPDANSMMNAPLDGLSPTQYRVFNAGAAEFDEVYHSATGLGPYYVANACGSCHSNDNRGAMETILFRYGQSDSTGNHYLNQGAPQWQNRAIPGYQPEQIPQGVARSGFLAPIAAGVGFLEAVPDTTLMAIARRNANNIDGVRGRPHWLNLPDFVVPIPQAQVQQGRYIGRFGRKASAHNLFQQTVQAFHQDMGITSTFIPQQPYNYLEGIPPTPGASPEVSQEGINDVVFYLQVLQAPPRRNRQSANVLHGEQLFTQIGCATCHIPELKTGSSPISALNQVTFFPYTDLLLHDMGPKLDDGYTEGFAKSAEWRTTPLWGLGLSKMAQSGQYRLLHDGRAHSIQEAILWHGGESDKSRERYITLSETEKNNLLAFLESL